MPLQNRSLGLINSGYLSGLIRSPSRPIVRTKGGEVVLLVEMIDPLPKGRLSAAQDFNCATTKNGSVLYLVSCVKQKQSLPCEARDLYVSQWFSKARRYVEQQNGRWFILSAQHGLVEPSRVLAPYQLTLNAMPRPERERWASSVWQSLTDIVEQHPTVVILAGRRYAELLVPRLAERGVSVELPLHGLGIGSQLHWFVENTL